MNLIIRRLGGSPQIWGTPPNETKVGKFEGTPPNETKVGKFEGTPPNETLQCTLINCLNVILL